MQLSVKRGIILTLFTALAKNFSPKFTKHHTFNVDKERKIRNRGREVHQWFEWRSRR